MSVLSRVARAEIIQTGGTPGGVPVNLEPWLEAFRTSGMTAAGKAVTVQGALGVAAVWAAVRVLSDTIGTLPLIVYQRQGESRVRAASSRSYGLLHDQPNPEMNASTMWRLVAGWMNTWGNAYLGKEFRGRDVTALWPVRPDRMTVERRGGQKVFVFNDDGRVYTQREVIHLYGPTLDGMTGLSPIGYARESIGSALAMDEWVNSFFRAGALPRMVLKSKKQLSDQAKKSLRDQWEARYGGSKRANRVAVLEEDTDVQLLSLPQKDLEFVEQRKWSVQEAARWFRVPVSLIEGDKGGSLTYSTVEMDALHFVTHSIRPWLVAIESEINRDPDLFPTRRLYSEFLLDGLLRASTLDRYNAWRVALDPAAGWMKPNEVRPREGLPTDPDFDLPRPLLPPQDAIVPVPAEGQPANGNAPAPSGR